MSISTYGKKKDNTLTGCHAVSRQESLFKNSNEDIYEKCN